MWKTCVWYTGSRGSRSPIPSYIEKRTKQYEKNEDDQDEAERRLLLLRYLLLNSY